MHKAAIVTIFALHLCCALASIKCDDEFRTLVGVCTNAGGPRRMLLGGSDRVHFTYFDVDSSVPRGGSLPSARAISNALFQQTANVFDDHLNELAAYFLQFLSHDLSRIPINRNEMLNISLAAGDEINGFTDYIPFFRSERKADPFRDLKELPVNAETSAIDLSQIYGSSKIRNNLARTGIDGLMAMSPDNLLPLGTTRIDMFPMRGSMYFRCGDPRCNENPVLTSLYTLFMREHNRIAVELKMTFPTESDYFLFNAARFINGAQYQKIVYEQLLSAFLGRRFPLYQGFRKSVDPSVSISFSSAVFPIFQSMTGDELKRAGPGNTPMPSLSQLFYPTVSTLQRDGIDLFIRGAFGTSAQKIDLNITDARRNQLYAGIVNLDNVVDIAADTIQRGRDHALPSFSAHRDRFGGRKANQFSDITTNVNLQKGLKAIYNRASSVDLFVGLLAEDHLPNKSIGTTLKTMIIREFRRLRLGDRLYFKSAGAIPAKLANVATVRSLLSDEDSFRRVVLANTGIAPQDLPADLFLKE